MHKIRLMTRAVSAFFAALANKPELAVLIIGGVFGFLFIIVLPPMQGADEPNHLFRTYQIASGGIDADYIGNKNGRSVGGSVPESLAIFADKSLNVVSPGNQESKYSRGKIKLLAHIKNQRPTIPVSFSNTAVYSPVAYAPRIPAIWLGRLFDVKPITQLYMARIMGFVICLLIIAYAIKILPFGKLPFSILALLPMTLNQLAVVTADSFMIALSFLAVSYSLYLYKNKAAITNAQTGYLIAVYVLLCLTKPSVLPLVLVVICLLYSRYMGSQKKAFVVGVVMLGSALAALLWNKLTEKMSAYGYSTDFIGTNYHSQLAFIIHTPQAYARVLYETLLTTHFDDVLVSFIGKFGWLDTPIPLFATILGYGIIAFAIYIAVSSEKVMLPRLVRYAALAAAIGVIVLTLTSQYLYTMHVKVAYVSGVQGRYFLPAVVPLVLFFFKSDKATLKPLISRRLSARCYMAATALLVISFIALTNRFYPLPALVHLP